MYPNNQSRIRRITLPSGHQIEVFRFDRPDSDRRELHICPSCESELVQPTDWSVSDADYWALTLECPNCSWHESGVYGPAQVARLEDQLDAGLGDLIADLRRLTQANMAADIERFVDALRRDLILPEDF